MADSVAGSFNLVDSFVFDMAPSTAPDNVDFSQNIDLSSYLLAADVRLIRFSITSSYGAETYTGLSEVRFNDGPNNAASVPAPLSVALFGIGLVGMSRLRGNRRNA